MKKNIFFIFFLCYTFTSFGQKEAPILTEIVTDNARIFTDNEEVFLRKKLTDFEAKTTTQIVILTITSLEGETIEGYALEVFDKNNLGQKNVDNGILILFSRHDKEVRIEVGYGLESTITDALASRIIREIMIPNFKKEQYFEGINEGTNKIIELINNPELIEEFIANTDKKEGGVTLFGRIFGVVFLTPIFFLLFIFGYNKIIVRNNKSKKISIKKMYKKNRERFLIILFSGLLLVAFFPLFFYQFFGVLLAVCFFSVFLGAGIFLLSIAYKALVEAFQGLFTGKLGLFIFPFQVLPILPFSLGGIVFTIAPLFFAFAFLADKYFDIDNLFSDFEPIYILYLAIGFLLIFLISAIIFTICKMVNKKQSFGFSLFKKDMKFTTISSGGSRSGSRSSYSSSSSYSRSSSSSRSFSGGGGSSGGGGASGSW